MNDGAIADALRVVFLTADAARDLEELYQYIALHDAPGKEEHVLTSIEKAIGSLSESPDRGAHPKDLLVLGIRDYRGDHSHPTA